MSSEVVRPGLRWSWSPIAHSTERVRRRQSLLIPLSSLEDHMLGMLIVRAGENGQRPSPDTVEVLETFASTAGAALERVRIEKRLMKIYELS